MEIITTILDWLNSFLVTTGIAENIDGFIQDFFKNMGEMGEIIVLSTFFLILFIRIFKFLLLMMIVFILLKFGGVITN